MPARGRKPGPPDPSSAWLRPGEPRLGLRHGRRLRDQREIHGPGEAPRRGAPMDLDEADLVVAGARAVRIVSRPSVTVTVEVPSIQRVEVVGVPLTVSTPSTFSRNTLSKCRASPDDDADPVGAVRRRRSPRPRRVAPASAGASACRSADRARSPRCDRASGPCCPHSSRSVWPLPRIAEDQAAVGQISGGHGSRGRLEVDQIVAPRRGESAPSGRLPSASTALLQSRLRRRRRRRSRRTPSGCRSAAPAVSAIVPLFSASAWSVQLFTSCWPLTHSRTPSSLCV